MNVFRCVVVIAAILIAPLCPVSASTSKAALQPGFCAGWPEMPNTLEAEGYQGLFSGLVFHLDENNIDWAKEMVGPTGAGSHKITQLERLNKLLWTVLHVNELPGTRADKEDLLRSAQETIQIEGTSRFPLYYILFYYANDHRLAIVFRDVKFDENNRISPGERGCVAYLFSQVKIYDFRKDSGDKDDHAPPFAESMCKFFAEIKLKTIRCGAYSDVIKDEASKGRRVFMKMPFLEKWQKLIIMKSDMSAASIFTEDHHGTMMEDLAFNIVFITDYMKSLLDELP